MEKTRKRPLLSIATIGSLIRQPNVYKMGLVSLLYCQHDGGARNQRSTLISWVKEAEEWCITSPDIEAVIDQS